MTLKEYFDSIPATLDAIVNDGLHEEMCDFNAEQENEEALNNLLLNLQDAFENKWKMMMSVEVNPQELHDKLLVKYSDYIFLVTRPKAYKRLVSMINSLIEHIESTLSY